MAVNAERDTDVHDDSQDTVGASIAGRRTYDTSIAWWGADGPGFVRRTRPSSSRTPLPTTCPRAASTPSSAAHARAAKVAIGLADGKDVDVFSASIGGHLLRAGLVDEVRIHLAPVPLGADTRLLDDDEGHIRLRPTRISESSRATRHRYRVATRLRYRVLTADGTG